MKQKLLNFSKNLIISLGLVVIVMALFFTTRSYAATDQTLGQLMRTTISDWYRFILRTSLSIYAIGYLIIVIKLLADRTPDRMKIVKESIGRFVLMFAVIYFLHYIMLMIIMLNAEGINTAKAVGASFSGIDMQNDEYDLYETALSKAYEIAAVPGFIGLVMYLLLVYYTYKFVIVYAKRYINIVVLTLLAPIIFVMSTIKKILTGASDGRIGKWFKEYIFNVIIQTLHAIFYAILIGLTLKFSDDNENLIGALLTLIIFGFIFKIDAIIRKIFNFVGGSTKISSNKAVGKAINVTGDALGMGLDALSGGIGSAGDKFATKAGNAGTAIREKGFGQAVKDSTSETFKNVQGKFKDIKTQGTQKIEEMKKLHDKAKKKVTELKDKAANAIDELPDKIEQKANDTIEYIKSDQFKIDAMKKLAEAKETAKDVKAAYDSAMVEGADILNGERVKANLTADEIIAAQHSIDKAEGLEGLRQKIQAAGIAIGTGASSLGKYTSKQLNKAYNFANGRVKAGLNSIVDEFNQDVRRLNLENEVELVKKMPRIIRNYQKNHKLIQMSYNGVKLDTTTAMMLMIDVHIDTRALLEEIKNAYMEDNMAMPVLVQQLGAIAVLSPTVGSARFGLAMLAEDRYEEVAEHRLTDLLTGKKRAKRVIKKRVGTDRKFAAVSNIAVEVAKTTVTNDKTEVKHYTFNRFSAASARKITNRMLNKTKQSNVYLASIDRVQKSVEVNELTARGRMSTRTTELTHTIKATRTNQVKSVRNIKLTQQAAVAQHKELTRQTRRVEMANNVAGQIMTAANTVRLQFMEIDQMTPGQVGLKKMVQEGTARQLSSGLFAVKQNGTIEDKIRATGIVKAQEPQSIVQFVMTETGNLVQQVVNTEGKIVQPAENLQQVTFKQVIQDALVEYMKPVNVSEDVQVVSNEGQEKAEFKEMMQEVFVQHIQPEEAPKEEKVQDTFTQTITQAFAEYIKPEAVEQRPPVEVMEGETEVEAQYRQFVEEVYETYVQPAEESVKIEPMDSTEKVVQHIVTLEGLIVEQVVNSDNTIETGSYQVVQQADPQLMAQLQDTVTNEDLGLEKDATLEDKVAKFQDLLEDLQREDATNPLLQEILAEPAEEEEKELVTVLSGMQEAGIETISELKQLQYVDGLDEDGLQKRETFEQFMATQASVTTYSSGDEEDDRLADALDVLNNSIEATSNNTILFDAAAELERTRIAEDLMNTGEFTIENPPTDDDIDARVKDLSNLLVNLAKDKVVDVTAFPRGVLQETADAMTDVLDRAVEGTRSNEEIEAEEKYRKELEKAEKKWAKRNGEEIDSTIVDRIEKQENDEEDATVKITIKFFGGVQNQGQAVSLSNRFSMKDFYDRVNKLDGANLEKTQERFLQTYGDKLKEMQLLPFSFGKNPVAEMDGWSVYIVTNQEDVTEGDKVIEELDDDEPIEETLLELIEKYFKDIRRIFTKFVEEHEIESFDEIYDEPDLDQELIRRVKMFLFRQGEEDIQDEAEDIVENLYKDSRFKDILKEIVEDRNAKNDAQDAVKKAKSKVKVTNQENAEKEASTKVTEEEVKEFKEKEKSDLMDQVLDSVMTEQEEAAAVSPDLNDLLNQLKENKVFVTTPGGENNTQNRRVLTYQTREGEMRP